MCKLWKVLPDEKLAVVPQRATGKLMVGKGSGIHIYPPRWAAQTPSIHPLDSEDGHYVGIITAPTGTMATGHLSQEVPRRLLIIASGAEGNCGLVTGARLFGDFRKSDVVGRVKSG